MLQTLLALLGGDSLPHATLGLWWNMDSDFYVIVSYYFEFQLKNIERTEKQIVK